MTARLLHLLPDRTDLIEANIKLELLFLQTNHIWFNWKEERTSQNEWASVDLFLMVLMRAAAWPSLPWLTSHRGLSGMAGCSSRNTRCRDTENTPSRYQSPSSRAEKYYIEEKIFVSDKNITLKEKYFCNENNNTLKEKYLYCVIYTYERKEHQSSDPDHPAHNIVVLPTSFIADLREQRVSTDIYGISTVKYPVSTHPTRTAKGKKLLPRMMRLTKAV